MSYAMRMVQVKSWSGVMALTCHPLRPWLGMR